MNADNIAAGISPFNVEGVAIEAGRIMLQRIEELLLTNEDFTIETTLTTRSYVGLVHKAKTLGYTVSLIYIWLNSPELALQRVAERVKKGGHNIPTDVIVRRYFKGLINLFALFMPVCDNWVAADNSNGELAEIASKKSEFDVLIEKIDIWTAIKSQAYDRQSENEYRPT